VSSSRSSRPCCFSYKDASLSGQIAQQNALPVADDFRVDVFVRRGVLSEPLPTCTPAFGGECTIAYKRLVAAQGQIRQFAMKRAVDVRCPRFSRPMVVCPIFSSRLAMIDVRLALPQRSP